MAAVLLETVCRIWVQSAWLRARRRASFSGFGGTGGTGMGAWVPVWEGSVTSKESSRRSVGGLGAGGACRGKFCCW